jgi:hypothetical protein
MRASPDLWPALALASGLAPPFGEAWAAAVRDDAGADELEAFAVGLRDGARLSQTAIDQAARDCGARLLADPDEAAEAAPILISLPLSSETRDALRPLLTTALGRNRALAVDALVAAHWDEPGPDADERLRAFIVGARPEPPSPPPPEPNVLLMPERDELYGGAFEAAAVRLAAGLRADAELVAGAFEDGGIEFRWELQQALRRGGHDDLAADVNLGMSGFGRFAADWNLEDFEACERALLGWAAALAPPVVLCARQRRRLDDLADLWATAALNWVHPSWPLKRPELAEMWLGAVAVIGGFDLGVVAAQAQIVLDDMDMGEQTEKLVYDHAEGPVVPLDRWDLAQDPATLLRDLVEMLGLCAHQVAWRAARAIGTAPQDLGAAGLLEYRLKHLRKWSRWFAARLMLIVEEDPAGAGPGGDVRAIRWASSEDMWLRAAAAEWLAYRYLATGGEAGSAALDLLADPDETVRDAALDGFGLMPEHLDERARRALRATRESDRQPWTCIYCGESNPAAAQPGCSSCHTSGPSVRSHVGEILGERPGAADQIRFASRRRSRRRRA